MCGIRQCAGELGQQRGGVAGQLVGGAARHGVEYAVFLELACDGSESMTDGSRPITIGGILFGGGAVLGRAELGDAEQRRVAAAVGAHSTSGDPDGDHDRDREKR